MKKNKNEKPEMIPEEDMRKLKEMADKMPPEEKEILRRELQTIAEAVKKAADNNNGEIPEDFFDLLTPAESVNTDYIDDFLSEHFGGGEIRVFHEVLSDTVHIDVFVKYPDENRSYYVLMTSGMSDLPMTVPEEWDDEAKAEYERAELIMFLPKDWKLDDESMKDIKYYWPVYALKSAARFPHLCETFIAHGHDLQFTEPTEPFAENTELCAFMFAYLLDEELTELEGKDGMKINIYTAVPIYPEELEFKISYEEDGGTRLLNKIFDKDEITLEDYIIDINRKNTCV